MVNCNPETVSTDYDTSDRLYFEPVTLEDVLEIVHVEKPWGVIVQYGGQTPLKLARDLAKIRRPDHRHHARHDRHGRGSRALPADAARACDLLQPPNRTARTEAAALTAAESDRLSAGGAALVRAGRPRDGDRARAARPRALHARGGQGHRTIRRSCSTASSTTRSRSMSTRMCDGKDVVIGGIMEHIEQAGVHSGDSACSLPPFSLSARTVQDELRRQTVAMAHGAECRRPDERAVRDPVSGRQRRQGGGVRARSQSARVADGAVCVQGDGPPAGQDRRAVHGGPHHLRAQGVDR